MGAFFTGWRRKSGCVTLLFALILTGVWMRSLFFVDVVVFKGQMFTASTGSVIWDAPAPRVLKPRSTVSSRWSTDKLNAEFMYFTAGRNEWHPQVDWHLQLFGFGFGEYVEQGMIHRFWAAPY